MAKAQWKEWKEGEVIFKGEYEHRSYDDYENEEPDFDPFWEDFHAFLEAKGLLVWDAYDMETYFERLPSLGIEAVGVGVQEIEVIDKETSSPKQKILLRRICYFSGKHSVNEVKMVGFEDFEEE